MTKIDQYDLAKIIDGDQAVPHSSEDHPQAVVLQVDFETRS